MNRPRNQRDLTPLELRILDELEQRGTAEISDGVVNQVTQAIDETETKVRYLEFGELRQQGIIPIEKACAKCDVWRNKFKNTMVCQETQLPDAKARGFTKLICPQQFKD